jgi:hypothetical protein
VQTEHDEQDQRDEDQKDYATDPFERAHTLRSAKSMPRAKRRLYAEWFAELPGTSSG